MSVPEPPWHLVLWNTVRLYEGRVLHDRRRRRLAVTLAACLVLGLAQLTYVVTGDPASPGRADEARALPREAGPAVRQAPRGTLDPVPSGPLTVKRQATPPPRAARHRPTSVKRTRPPRVAGEASPRAAAGCPTQGVYVRHRAACHPGTARTLHHASSATGATELPRRARGGPGWLPHSWAGRSHEGQSTLGQARPRGSARDLISDRWQQLNLGALLDAIFALP